MRWTCRRSLAIAFLSAGAALVVAASVAPRTAAAGPAATPSAAPSFDLSGLPTPTPQTTPTPWTSAYPGGVSVGPTFSPQPTPETTPTPAPGTVPEDSPGLFDIGGHIRQAIDDWFRSVVQSALDPVLSFLGQTILATPGVADEYRVKELWGVSAGIANGLLILFALVGAGIVMGHETVQSRHALKDILPRLIVGAIAANASLAVAGLLIHTANALSQAFLGEGVDPVNATAAIRDLVVAPIATGGIFVILVGLVVAVLTIMLVCIYIARVATLILLVVAAPLALICHALPQTDGLAQLWWRSVLGLFAVQVGQSLVLVTALRVFFDSDHHALGFALGGGVVDMLLCICLLWVLVKIPSWVGRWVRSGQRRGGGVTGQLAKAAVLIKIVAAAL